LYFIVKNVSLGARLKERAAINSPEKVQLVQKTGSKIKLTEDFQSVLKDIFEKVLFNNYFFYSYVCICENKYQRLKKKKKISFILNDLVLDAPQDAE
jgi:hypothetical protein